MNSAPKDLEPPRRSQTYAFISSLYSAAPSEDLARMLQNGTFLKELGLEEKDSAYAELKEFARASSSMTTPHLARELAAEYSSLFVLPTSGLRPYESFFLDKERKVGGKVTIAVRRFYEHAQASLSDRCLDIPDHIGVELEFMKFLCDIEEEALGKKLKDALSRNREIQREFLEKHLLKWVRLLCDAVRSETQCGFYLALAFLTSDFMKGEETRVLRLPRKTNKEEVHPL